MEILVKVRKLLPYVGALEIDHPKGRLISKTLLILSFAINIFSLLTTIWFFVFDAKHINDQTNALGSIIMITYIIWIYSIFIWKRYEFMELIGDLEHTIENRT